MRQKIDSEAHEQRKPQERIEDAESKTKSLMVQNLENTQTNTASNQGEIYRN